MLNMTSGARYITSKSDLTYTEGELIGYATSNINEFITYSFTSSDFQSALKKLKPKNANSGETYFHKLANAIKKLLGFSKEDTFLERAINASSELIESIKEPSAVKSSSSKGKYKTITNNPDPKATNLKGSPYTLDYHNNLRKALAAGELSVDDLKAAFRTLMDNQEEVLTRFNKYKKDNLIAVSRRYAANKKDAVENDFEFLRNTFLLGKEPPSLKYDPFMMGKGAKNLKDSSGRPAKKNHRNGRKPDPERP